MDRFDIAQYGRRWAGSNEQTAKRTVGFHQPGILGMRFADTTLLVWQAKWHVQL